MSINHEPLHTNPVASTTRTTEDQSHSQYDQDNHQFQDAESEDEVEEKLVPLSDVFHDDQKGKEEEVEQSQSVQSVPVISSIKTDPVTGVKYVDNYSGLYSKEEVLALHRLDYQAPADFVWEDDITSRSVLMPVASFRYNRRELDGSSNASSHESNEQWEGNFFSRSVGRGRGRGRGRRDDQFGDEQLRGARGGAIPFDNTWRSASESFPPPQDAYSAPLWQSNNPNATSFQSSYRPTKRQLAASSAYPTHHSDLYQLQEDLSYAN
jgi:hypothetical protein